LVIRLSAFTQFSHKGVSAPAEAFLPGFIGNQGKASFSEISYGCWFGPSGTHKTFLRNPRRPIESLAACELNFPESILAYKKRAYFSKNKTVIVKKWHKSAFSQPGVWLSNILLSDVTHHTFYKYEFELFQLAIMSVFYR
jgi:hypothetical protein